MIRDLSKGRFVAGFEIQVFTNVFGQKFGRPFHHGQQPLNGAQPLLSRLKGDLLHVEGVHVRLQPPLRALESVTVARG